MTQYKLEFVAFPDDEPMWFDDKEELDATVEFIKGCYCDDGPAMLRITEYGPAKVEIV